LRAFEQVADRLDFLRQPEDGKGRPDQIAAPFGVSRSAVKQRLRLGAVSPSG
jgi:hypothetical protein